MNISAPFIRRPVATTLLTVGITLAGAIAFSVLPVSPLPQVDFPTISVRGGLPGGSPEIMASSIATPLERQFGHIAGVTEMTSSSSLGSTNVTMQFDLSRNIDGAARDVEAAINAARTYLPADLPGNPTYRKVNPADSPIMILGLTSDKYDKPTLYDEASSVIAQKLSQLQGVGQVNVGGGAGPSVRVEVNPTQLNSYGLSISSVRATLSQQNVHEAAGQLNDGDRVMDIVTNDQMHQADDYKGLVVGYHNGQAVRLSDVADVYNGAQDLRQAGYLDGVPSVTVMIFRQPGANIIETNDNIKAELPSIEASIPQGIKITLVLDRTTTIRASVNDVERSLIGSVILVILVVFMFLRNWRATLIPTVAVPASLVSTFAVMYLFGYSLDNLSLMALTISTGFVVDDAIVVMENITRLREHGMSPLAAAFEGSRQIGFTIFSISMSLIAVFIPILLMAGIVGRLFREFAVTLSTAIVMSMIVSLTTTPMMCAYVLKDESKEKHGRLYRISEKGFSSLLSGYSKSLKFLLDHPGPVLAVLLLTIGLNFYLGWIIPKGFFPQQDTGALVGAVVGPQDASFPVMDNSVRQLVKGDQGRPGGGTRECVHGLREWRLYLCCTEAACCMEPVGEKLRRVGAGMRCAQDRGAGHYQPSAPEDEPASGGVGIFAGGAGSAHWWSLQRRTLPIHNSVRQCGRPIEVGPDSVGPDEEAAGLSGCEQRCAKLRFAGLADVRPANCGAIGCHAIHVGQLSLQRVWTIGSLDYLYAVESVLCSSGSCAEVHAGPFFVEGHLSEFEWQGSGAAVGRGHGADQHHAFGDQPHQFVSFGYSVVQPGSGTVDE